MKWWDQLQTPQVLHQPSAHEMLGSATDTPGTAPQVLLQTPQVLHQPSAHEMLWKCWDQLQTPQVQHQPSAHEML